MLRAMAIFGSEGQQVTRLAHAARSLARALGSESQVEPGPNMDALLVSAPGSARVPSVWEGFRVLRAGPEPFVPIFDEVFGASSPFTPQHPLHPLTPVSSPEGTPLSTAQRAMASGIAWSFERAGWDEEMIAAALTSAWAESRFNPRAWGDRARTPEGCSGGLFQLNRCGGAGTDLTREQVETPEVNVRRVLEILDGRFGRALLQEARRGPWTVSRLAALFTIHIMRPANAAKKAQERAEMASTMFPLLDGSETL